MRMVSATLSPLAAELLWAEEKPSTCPPQPPHGRLEAEPGAGAGLEKQGGQNFALAAPGIVPGPVQNTLGQAQQPGSLLPVKVQWVDQMPHDTAAFPKHSTYFAKKPQAACPAAVFIVSLYMIGGRLSIEETGGECPSRQLKEIDKRKGRQRVRMAGPKACLLSSKAIIGANKNVQNSLKILQLAWKAPAAAG